MSHENEFGTWGRYQELQLDQMTTEQRRTYDYMNEQRGQVPRSIQDLASAYQAYGSNGSNAVHQ
jgi:hypothetical protein